MVEVWNFGGPKNKSLHQDPFSFRGGEIETKNTFPSYENGLIMP